MRFISIISLLLIFSSTQSQTVSKVWVADNGNGTYKNPVIDADYSDPDAIRVGADFYMTASSFNHVPGLPILHSKDLVNWKLIGHALARLVPVSHFDTVRHGGGVWAPSIRYHNNEFYIYYPDPDFGIYLVKSKNINGPWSDPIMVQAGKGLIDPCPLWDDDGKVYLTHAYAGSRAGFKSIIVVKELSKDGTKVISDAVMVYDGHEKDPTIEGPKFYKRNGYYYIFAPAGGVSTGWQTVLRSKTVYGPYERKLVMDQGSSIVNGPHQGAWINTATGEDWFLHFQDKEAFGRVVHLQPLKWVNGWPVIGNDANGDGKGEPVSTYKKPNLPKQAIQTPAESDEFNDPKLGLQWQWQANPKEGWAMPTNDGTLRMFSVYRNDSAKLIWNLPNILGQKFPTQGFKATIRFKFQSKHTGERFGLVVLGTSYQYIAVQKQLDGNYLIVGNNQNNAPADDVQMVYTPKLPADYYYFQVIIDAKGLTRTYYSKDGVDFKATGDEWIATPGKWVGARLGIFCVRNNITNDAGYADIDWFHIEPLR